MKMIMPQSNGQDQLNPITTKDGNNFLIEFQKIL